MLECVQWVDDAAGPHLVKSRGWIPELTIGGPIRGCRDDGVGCRLDPVHQHWVRQVCWHSHCLDLVVVAQLLEATHPCTSQNSLG